jgi:phosphoribosylanthranilate isomerase
MKLPKGRVAVKICGLTNPQDAALAVQAGADFLGFNTWPGTKRFIDLDANSEWISELPVNRVALFVNATLEEVRRVATMPFVDALQFHGDEDAAYCQAAALFGKPIIKAVRLRGMEVPNLKDFRTEHILIDAHVPGSYGGTGSQVDIESAAELRRQHPELIFWLAGGLKPENVTAAVAAVLPNVVDVSSGVEREGFRKDAIKMRDFVAAAQCRI